MTALSNAPTMTEAERRLRKEAVKYARASVALEGFKLNSADERHAERFISGEIELSEFIELRGEPVNGR